MQLRNESARREGVSRPRVLLAEDHDDTRDALKMLLELQGYEVFAAKDGEEALRLALQAAPDVVITDYDMPRLDGAELARELRSMTSHLGKTPILILTALSQPMIQQALNAGANAYIAKPVDFQTLESALRLFVPK
jgi:CheY-like chemotaxis protein